MTGYVRRLIDSNPSALIQRRIIDRIDGRLRPASVSRTHWMR